MRSIRSSIAPRAASRAIRAEATRRLAWSGRGCRDARRVRGKPHLLRRLRHPSGRHGKPRFQLPREGMLPAVLPGGRRPHREAPPRKPRRGEARREVRDRAVLPGVERRVRQRNPARHGKARRPEPEQVPGLAAQERFVRAAGNAGDEQRVPHAPSLSASIGTPPISRYMQTVQIPAAVSILAACRPVFTNSSAGAAHPSQHSARKGRAVRP